MITEKDVGKRIAENIRLIMIKNKLTQVEIGEKMGYTKSAVNNLICSIEQGKGTFKTICKYANALGVSPYVLFYENKLVPRDEE